MKIPFSPIEITMIVQKLNDDQDVEKYLVSFTVNKKASTDSLALHLFFNELMADKEKGLW